MADNFSANHVQGVWGVFKPVIDETVDTSADQVQGVWGAFKVVLDEAAGAAAPAVTHRRQGVSLGSANAMTF